jgi:predicted RecA/RadA family phage recombinase
MPITPDKGRLDMHCFNRIDSKIQKRNEIVRFLVIVFFVFSFPTVTASQDIDCKTKLKIGDHFQCDVIKAFNFDENAKIQNISKALNGKIGKINDDTITFVPNANFSGQQEIRFTINSNGKEHQKNLVLNYFSAKDTLLAPGQMTAIGTLLLLVLALAIVLEFALRHIFQWRWFIIFFEGRGIKFVASLGVALMLVVAVDVNLVEGFSSIIGNNEAKSPVLGPILTALIISGGSATVLQFWKMFKFLPEPGISGTAVKQKNFSRVKVIVDRSLMSEEQKQEPLEIYIDGNLVGNIEPNGEQYPPYNFFWGGHPVESKEHTYEVVYAAFTKREMRWRRRHGLPHLNVKNSVLHFKLDPKEVAFIQTGDLLTLTAPTALKAGDPFKVGSIIAIASTDAESGGVVNGLTTGVYDVPKVAGIAFTQGDKVYWNDTDRAFTKTATGNTLAGVAVVAAASAATTARVRLKA